ncbi:hypothetical protein [Nocardiopsis eucommiae]|uniref:hypothetical protein n=1 Tax=Nocardiopsis eucommiae TaxID=2831970 RepID=UPI003D75C3E0
MGSARKDVPGSAPVPLRTGFEDALAHFHAQSHEKDVSQVATLFFGAEPSNGLARPVPGQVRTPLPALGPLRDLDAATPALGGGWSPVERLLAACVEAVRVRRISAADRYPVHRAYPSPRGLFGADLFLVAPGDPTPGGGPTSPLETTTPGDPTPPDSPTWCLRVDPQSHALQPVGGPAAPSNLEGARLVVAVDQHRYPPEYGRLRPSLARLEAGHLLATLGLTLTRAGLRPRTHPDPAHPACTAAAPLLPPGMTPIAAVTLDVGDPGTTETTAHPGTCAPSVTSGTSLPDGSDVTHNPGGTATHSGIDVSSGTAATRPPHLTPGSENGDGSANGDGPGDGVTLSPEATARVAASVAPAGRTLRRWLDERTSGVSTANLVTSAYVSPEQGATITSGLVHALAAVHEVLPRSHSLRLYQHTLEDDRVDDRVVRELPPDGPPGPARPVPRTGETNFSATLGHTLAVDFPAWARALGPDHAETVLHTLLGWIAQWGCLGAAATDLCVRPMRNYAEADWAAALGLDPDQTPAYQLWVRAERGTYLDTPVDAAPETP